MVLVERESASCSEAHVIRKLIDMVLDIKTRHKIAKEVKDIKIQLKEVSDRFLRYQFLFYYHQICDYMQMLLLYLISSLIHH
jgi:hypothetical protein